MTTESDMDETTVLPVLWMTLCFHSMGPTGQNQARRYISMKFARWQPQLAVGQLAFGRVHRNAAPEGEGRSLLCTIALSCAGVVQRTRTSWCRRRTRRRWRARACVSSARRRLTRTTSRTSGSATASTCTSSPV